MYKLRDYQIQAVEKTVAHFQESNDPSVIVLPTGAGKSLVIANLALKANSRVLVLAHVKELVAQNHQKYESYGFKASIFSASLNRKELNEKVTFASIQSFSNIKENDLKEFSLIIIDECHRVSLDNESQYQSVFNKLKKINPQTKFLGLTATPYRLDTGWIYNIHYKGILRTEDERFFKKCIFELPLRYMIKNKFLTPPVLIDSPIASYDFSALFENRSSRSITTNELNKTLQDQKRVTPVIVKDIINLSSDKKGVMIFTSTVKHAKEVLSLLPPDNSELIIGNTDNQERDEIITKFKEQKVKYLVNVSVLTTGFDAPHVDLIAILRPTESISLYQQIVGRGLRLYPEKEECLILDYTGLAYNIFSPQIDDKRPNTKSVAVKVNCPQCNFSNDFWGLLDDEGNITEHFGRRCQFIDLETKNRCNYLFRFKRCPDCDFENDISARTCNGCQAQLVDVDDKLKEARSLKDAHIMRVDTMLINPLFDKKRNCEKLEINYYDVDANNLKETYFLESHSQQKAFYYNFVRSHLKLPEEKFNFKDATSIANNSKLFRMPLFVIARQNKKVWNIREKIFPESLKSKS